MRSHQPVLFEVEPVVHSAAPIFLFGPDLELPSVVAAPNDHSRVLRSACLRAVDLTETHGVKVTDGDIDQMIFTYSPAYEVATLNFDHAWKGPAHGLCTRIYRDGEFLVSDWQNLSEEAIEGLDKKRYPRVSAEFWTRHPQLGTWYFTGLALLGARAPAVPGLPSPQLLAQRPIYRVLMTAPAAASAPAQEPDMKKPDPQPADPPAIEPPGDETVVVAGEEPAPATPVEPEPEPEPDDADDEGEEPAPAAPANASAPAPVAANAPNSFEARALRAEARLEVREYLDSLGNRLPPAVRKLAEPLLVELSAAPREIHLSADAAPVSVADELRKLLAALPPFAALGARQSATADQAEPAAPLADDRPEEVRALHARLGITDDRIRELANRYALKTVN